MLLLNLELRDVPRLNPQRRLTMRRFIRTLSLPLITLFVAAAGLAAFGRLVGKSPGPGTIPVAPMANTDQLEVELISVRPEGFEPLEIIRPKGPFVLVVDDRSGRENSSFQLRQLKGERLRDLTTNRKKAEWYDVFNLPPGKYILTDAANPERQCQITIQP
jgi:hypothetical protein